MSRVKAAELHRLARAVLGPTLAELGFRRAPGTSTAGWVRPVDDQWLVLWVQPARGEDVTSPGLSFTVELRRSEEPLLGAAGFRRRLPALMTAAELEELRELENRTVAKLPAPDRRVAGMLPPELRDGWLGRWRPRAEPYPPDGDPWFRHADERDVHDLLALVRRVLPGAIERFLAQAPEPR